MLIIPLLNLGLVVGSSGVSIIKSTLFMKIYKEYMHVQWILISHALLVVYWIKEASYQKASHLPLDYSKATKLPRLLLSLDDFMSF